MKYNILYIIERRAWKQEHMISAFFLEWGEGGFENSETKMGTNPTFFTSWVNAFTLQYKVIVPLPVSKLFDSFTFIIRVWLKTCYMSRNIFFLVLIGMQKKCMPVSFSFLIAVQSDQTVFNTVVQQSVTEKSINCLRSSVRKFTPTCWGRLC